MAIAERKERQARAAVRQKQRGRERMCEAVARRGLLLSESAIASTVKDELAHQDAEVREDSEGLLHWPVMVLYPEFGTSDFLRDVRENTR